LIVLIAVRHCSCGEIPFVHTTSKTATLRPTFLARAWMYERLSIVSTRRTETASLCHRRSGGLCVLGAGRQQLVCKVVDELRRHVLERAGRLDDVRLDLHEPARVILRFELVCRLRLPPTSIDAFDRAERLLERLRDVLGLDLLALPSLGYAHWIRGGRASKQDKRHDHDTITARTPGM
jgi:hypothetical protein